MARIESPMKPNLARRRPGSPALPGSSPIHPLHLWSLLAPWFVGISNVGAANQPARRAWTVDGVVLCAMERLGLRVTDDGFPRIDDQAKRGSAAVEWNSLDAFPDWLVTRLTSPRPAGTTIQL